MKRYIILLITFSVLASCSYKEEPSFEEKSTNRVQDVIEKYKSILEEDTYWQLSYYPRVSRRLFDLPKADHSVGGYNIFLKFKDGKVYASAEFMPDNEEQITYFSYQKADAIMLSFDTYNDVLHHFYQTSGKFPNARGGDVELEILAAEENKFTVIGRSSGTKMILSKFSGNREEYLDKVRDNTKILRDKGLNTTQIGGKAVSMFLFPSYRQMVFSDDQQHIQQAFVVTDRGIKFFEPVTVNGVTLDELYFNEAKTALVSSDNTITISLQPAPLQITETPMKIRFDDDDDDDTDYSVSEYFQNIYNTTHSWIVWSYNWYNLKREGYTDLDIQLIKGNDNEAVVGFSKYIAQNANTDYIYEDGRRYVYGVNTYYEVDMVGVGDHPDQIRFILKDPDNHPSFRTGARRNQIQFYSWLVTILYQTIVDRGPYTVEDKGDYYLFTSVENSEAWFHLNKN